MIETELLRTATSLVAQLNSLARSISRANYSRSGNVLDAPTGLNERLRGTILELNQKFDERNRLLNDSDMVINGFAVMNSAEHRGRNHFLSPLQAEAYNRKRISIEDGIQSKKDEYKKAFGNWGGADLFWREARKSYSDDLLAATSNEWENELRGLTEQYGGGAVGGRNASRVMQEEASRRFTYDSLDEIEAKRRNLTVRYKGNSSLADQRMRDEADRLHSRVMMSDEDRKLDELVVKYNGNRGYAEEEYRKLLVKNLPRFFKNTTASTRDIKRMAKVFEVTKGVPIFGKAFGKNPIASGVSLGIAGYSVIKSVADTTATANEKVVGWKNAVNTYGGIDTRFQKAAYLAGMKDPNEVANAYGEIIDKYGSLEAFENIGKGLSGLKPGREKTIVTKRLGLDTTQAAFLDILSGNGGHLVDQVRMNNAKAHMFAAEKTLGLMSGTSLWSKISALFTDTKLASTARSEYNSEFSEFSPSSRDAARHSAESLDSYKASGDTVTTNTFVFNGDIVANDPQQLLQKTGEMVNGGNTEILERFNNRVNGAKR